MRWRGTTQYNVTVMRITTTKNYHTKWAHFINTYFKQQRSSHIHEVNHDPLTIAHQTGVHLLILIEQQNELNIDLAARKDSTGMGGSESYVTSAPDSSQTRYICLR